MKKRNVLILFPALLVAACDGGASTSSAEGSSALQTSAEVTSSATSSETSVLPEKAFGELYAEIARSMIVTGVAQEILVTDNGDVSSDGDLNLILGETGYHIEIGGDFALTSSLYKGEDDSVLHYYIGSDNTVQYEIAKASDGTELEWKDYDNPFKYISADHFVEGEEGVWSLDLTANADEAIYATSNLTYHTFPSLEEFSLIVTDEKISGIEIRTPVFEDSLGKRYYKFSLELEIPDEPVDYAKPEPLVTQPYHTVLKAALNQLVDATYKADQVISYGSQSYLTECYYGETYILIIDADYGMTDSYIEKENAVYELGQLGDSYYYNAEAVKDSSGKPLTSIHQKGISVSAVAPEFFSYDDTENCYILEGSAAGAFLYSMQPYADPQNGSSKSVRIYLDEEERIAKVEATGDIHSCTITYTYSGYDLPLDPETLKDGTKILLQSFAGTYDVTFGADTTGTLIVSEDGITLDGVAAERVYINDYGELAFVIGDTDYSINSRGNKLYDNTNGGTYTLSKQG